MQETSLVGIDEAGRGALAGPLFIGACRLYNLPNLADSKKLSALKREKLYSQIIQNSDYLILSFSNKQIDTLGLSYCLKTGLLIIKKHFKNTNFLYDGSTNFGVLDIKTLIKADDKIQEVSAASILAKVSRDEFMQNINSLYPAYEFAKHKGYGTKTHIEILKKLGPCPLHRTSFKLKENSSLFDEI